MAKKQNDDDEFERLVREFIDNEIMSDDTPDDNANTEPTLPFPKPMDDRVADAMMNAKGAALNFSVAVASVTIEIAPGYEKGIFWNGPAVVTFHPRHKVRIRPARFDCFIFNEDYYPVCTSKDCRMQRAKGKAMKMEMESDHIWIPGKYILLVFDNDGCGVTQIDFTIDEELKAKLGKPHLCPYGNEEDVLATCIQDKDTDWNFVAYRPGVVQFRRKAMEARRLVLYNEIRSGHSQGKVTTCENLLICTRNDDIDAEFLKYFQRVMFVSGDPICVDCATLYNPGFNNAYEPLNDMLAENMRAICLTNLKELMGPNGKVIMRAIIEKVRNAKGSISFWLCGTRAEIDELMGLYPSLRQFFVADSYVEQQPYTPFELVEAFFAGVVNEHMQPNILVKDRLTRTILQGYKQGVLTTWSLADVHRFIVEEIRPRYLRRCMEDMLNENGAFLQEEDIPFYKLLSGSSAFDECMRELSEMIGLDNVKQGIMTMANQARLFTERRRRGLHTSTKMIFHSIFTGNPGTGKTTVARKVGRIYRSLGLLSKGEVIAVDRTRLVGQYIGQTEDNMKVILEEAKGNVLFIDEAYNLDVGADDRRDFGGRVLEALLPILAQPNPDMLVIFAGYEKEMDAMLDTNPGLEGRFPYRYRFDDYTAEQLMEIALKIFERDDYILSEEAIAELRVDITIAVSMQTKNFGNARWVEQFVNNGIIPAMADRIYSHEGALSAGDIDLQHIEASDIEKAFENYRPKPIEPKPTRHRVKGFGA